MGQVIWRFNITNQPLTLHLSDVLARISLQSPRLVPKENDSENLRPNPATPPRARTRDDKPIILHTRTQCFQGQRRYKQPGCGLLARIVAWVYMPVHAHCFFFLQFSDHLRSSQQRRMVQLWIRAGSGNVLWL